MRSPVTRYFTSFIVSVCLLFQTQLVYATSVALVNETRVYIETRQDLIGKGDQVREGQFVDAVVWRDVVVNGHVLVAAGAPVVAKVEELKKRQIAGVKGQMTLGAYETTSVDGQTIQLSGGYHKDGKSRMALSITLGVLFILPIFIPGKAAELPTGTIFDAYIDNDWSIDVGDSPPSRKVDLSFIDADLSAELLYEKFEEQEKPEYFEFLITTSTSISTEFVIDRINSEEIKPLKLENISEAFEDDELIVNTQIKIKKLLKKLAKGINTIEIASFHGEERTAVSLVIDIEI
ncbi:MAG: hypothetical protein OEU84_01845 [Xanthomonadales bacterium]|nr:hypothetical protein [Xanthomonadales bacterium]